MKTEIIKVDGMMCEHCVQAVSGAVEALTACAAVDLANGTVTVTFDPQKTSVVSIKDAIEEQGYDVR